jgi:hypothetical protein
MSLPLRIAWAVFAGLCALMLLGVAALHIASNTVRARIDLVPGARVSMTVLRLVPDAPRLSMEFEDPARAHPPMGHWRSRPELGEWRPIRKDGSLRFGNPGETVKLRVVDQTQAQIYEALPNGGRSEGLVHRDLVRFVDDGDARTFRWPPLLPTRSIPAGRSALEVSVLEVGDAIRGESVTLVAEPPLGFKRGTGGAIDWLWYFYFWPAYALVLGITGVVLARITRKSSAAAP